MTLFEAPNSLKPGTYRPVTDGGASIQVQGQVKQHSRSEATAYFNAPNSVPIRTRQYLSRLSTVNQRQQRLKPWPVHCPPSPCLLMQETTPLDAIAMPICQIFIKATPALNVIATNASLYYTAIPTSGPKSRAFFLSSSSSLASRNR